MKTHSLRSILLELIAILVCLGLYSSAFASEDKIIKYNQDEFFQLILKAKDQKEIQRAFGRPEAVETYDEITIWYYRIPITGPDNTLHYPAIHFIEGQVNIVNYLLPDEMNQKIEMAKLRKKTLSSIGQGKKTFSAGEMYSLTIHRTPEEVRQVLGEPDRIWEMKGKTIWTYHKLISADGKIWDQHLQFDYGRVNYDWVEKPKE